MNVFDFEVKAKFEEIRRSGTRSESNRVATIYEIPCAVVAEAIINAVAHRDYQSNGSVQVSVFKNRVEIQNPGDLPEELSLSDLLIPHGSYPHNPLLANCLFLTGDIERYGTGTFEMCRRSKKQGLTAPRFTLPDGFKVILWRETAHTTGQVSGQVFTNLCQECHFSRSLIHLVFKPIDPGTSL